MGRKRIYTDEERKAAHRESKRKWAEANPEKVKESNRKWYETNSEKKKEKSRKHREENPDYYKQWREKNSDYLKQYYEEYYNTPIGRGNCLVNSYRREDKNHNRGECTITGEWMVDNVFSGQICYYCKESDWTKLGADRIDNSKSHTPDNVVPCCEECNKKRGTKSHEEFCKEMGVEPITVKTEIIYI